MTTFDRNESKLLSEISWYTNLILGPENVQDPDIQVSSFTFSLFEHQKHIGLQDFAAKVSDADKELSGSSADVRAARKVFRIESSPAGNVNEQHVYKAVQRILAYRILDVCQWITGTEPSLQSTAVPSLIGPHSDLLNKLVGTNVGSLFLVYCLFYC